METQGVGVDNENDNEDLLKINRDQRDSGIQIIPVQLIQSSSEVTVHSKGKYYKQTYRPAWELMPEFKGWLRGVEGEPTRAYCMYCHKNLHAHRLSLLKHICTIRHQKAAQMHKVRKNKELNMKEDSLENEDDRELSNDEDIEIDNEEEEYEDRSQLKNSFSEGAVEKDSEKPIIEKPPISTQVTDMTKGKPISGLQVSLYKLIDGRWTFINEGITNSAGKFFQFIDRTDFTTGRYKLHYDVDRYFEAKKQDTMYPFIEIIFDANLFRDCYHIPLLLSPHGYTTYRGS
ncbi:uncharacterized protein LOC130441351 [Diorhabda sublineata]|uniref:uncharacterized protein LOC130441351 n=1 Tax=Diorhabda sublineata TaxID=1163346 RepID=UPI0024E19175|nr:uncharacterized protein LOC130441351 [Diorhabda sublineata]